MSAGDDGVFLERLAADADALGVALTESQARSLLLYRHLLAKWNGVYNLTAIRDPEQMRVQHIVDSLAILPELDRLGGRSLIDIGSGGGLPGIVVAIMRPDWRVVLNDIVQKKTAFLTQAKATLGLSNISVHTGRAEQFADRDGFDIVASRAFASLADFVSAGRHLLVPGGAFVAMKGQQPAAEIAALPVDVRVDGVVALTVPRLDAARHVVSARGGL